jgi:hypothetical protein
VATVGSGNETAADDSTADTSPSATGASPGFVTSAVRTQAQSGAWAGNLGVVGSAARGAFAGTGFDVSRSWAQQ